MATKESGGRESPTAQRLRLLRSAYNQDNAAKFAKKLELSPQRWGNFENGHPLSKEIAFKLVQAFPGLTLDWLYLGVESGLTVELLDRLNQAAGATKGIKRPS